MTVLMGFMALATDSGILFRTRRDLQIAADAAAVAGALDYLYNANSTSTIAAGRAAASANGITHGTGGAVVSISVPPADGPNTENAAYVEAMVTKPHSTVFMGMFGFRSVTVGPRAVAGTPTTGNACIWLMATSGMAL